MSLDHKSKTNRFVESIFKLVQPRRPEYSLGWIASIDGMNFESNPFSQESVEYANWSYGWCHGEADKKLYPNKSKSFLLGTHCYDISKAEASLIPETELEDWVQGRNLGLAESAKPLKLTKERYDSFVTQVHKIMPDVLD